MDDDSVVEEIPVFLSPADRYYVFQYPFKRSENLQSIDIVNCKIKSKTDDILHEIAINTDSEHFDREKAWEIASIINFTDKNTAKSSASDEIMYKIVLTSTKAISQKAASNYAVGVLYNKEFHLAPLRNILALRPDFAYIDKMHENNVQQVKSNIEKDEDILSKQKKVYVKSVNSKYKRGSLKRSKQDEETWINMTYYDGSSEEAQTVMKSLFYKKDGVTMPFKNVPDTVDKYLEKIVNENMHFLSDTSLTNYPRKCLASFPLSDRIKSILLNVKIIKFSQLKEIFSHEKSESILKCLLEFATIVKGNWVVNSEILYENNNCNDLNGISQNLFCQTRNFILYLFTQFEYINLTYVTHRTGFPTEKIKEILLQISSLEENGWNFLLPVDTEFISEYNEFVEFTVCCGDASSETQMDTCFKTALPLMRIQTHALQAECFGGQKTSCSVILFEKVVE